MNNTIKICSSHSEYPTPLIWTFAFRGAEFWCPYCGRIFGMLGAGEDVEKTEELSLRKLSYQDMTKEYLHAVGTEICVSLVFNGERMSPEKLPQEEKDRLAEIRRTGWVKFTRAS